LNVLFLNIFSLCWFLGGRDQASRLYNKRQANL
jgi:hypothetical protein